MKTAKPEPKSKRVLPPQAEWHAHDAGNCVLPYLVRGQVPAELRYEPGAGGAAAPSERFKELNPFADGYFDAAHPNATMIRGVLCWPLWASNATVDTGLPFEKATVSRDGRSSWFETEDLEAWHAANERASVGVLLVPFARPRGSGRLRQYDVADFGGDPLFFLPYLNRMLYEYEARVHKGTWTISPRAASWKASDTMLDVVREARGTYSIRTTAITSDLGR